MGTLIRDQSMIMEAIMIMEYSGVGSRRFWADGIPPETAAQVPIEQLTDAGFVMLPKV